MSLQAALKNVSVPDFVPAARAAGDALPDGLLDGFNEEDFARALFARMALGGAAAGGAARSRRGGGRAGPRSRRAASTPSRCSATA